MLRFCKKTTWKHFRNPFLLVIDKEEVYTSKFDGTHYRNTHGGRLRE